MPIKQETTPDKPPSLVSNRAQPAVDGVPGTTGVPGDKASTKIGATNTTMIDDRATARKNFFIFRFKKSYKLAFIVSPKRDFSFFSLSPGRNRKYACRETPQARGLVMSRSFLDIRAPRTERALRRRERSVFETGIFTDFTLLINKQR